MRDFDELTTCSFTGHRIIKKDFNVKILEDIIESLIDKGYRTFLIGMAWGFDLIVFETLLSKKNKNIDIIACVPCKNQERFFNNKNKEKYFNLLKKADKIVYVSEEYFDGCMQKRNRYMIDNSSVLVAYLYSNLGGTKNAVNYALKQNKEIIYV